MKTIQTVLKANIKGSISILLLLLLLLMIGITGCSKDDAPPIAKEEVKLSDKKQITEFKFLAIDNTVLAADVIATIDINAKTISANLPSDIPLTALTPKISISPKAIVSPTGEKDFTDAVTYTVTAEDGTTSNYAVTATSKSSAKAITSFVFLLTNNPIEVNVVAIIDEENKTITAAMPPDTDITGLLPEVKTSEFSTVDRDTAQDFTAPLEYTVTAEDGSTTVYTISITTLLTQRQILQVILDANPGNTIDWDLITTANLEDLDGVVTDTEGRIISLKMSNRLLISIPSQIGQLTNLMDLDLSLNRLTSLPLEIKNMTQLKRFNLSFNGFSTLPIELTLLLNLERLELAENQIMSIPPEIRQLSKLTYLDLQTNRLSVVPPEVGFLTNLTTLGLLENVLTELPPEIGQLTNLTTLALTRNQLTELPPEISFLIKLEDLLVKSNNLNTIPSGFGLLTKLSTLDLSQNPITSIPQEVCDQQTSNGGILTILTDPGEGCD
ncbi:hypothetical protein [uncultured Maribacter sp.]|uniref:DUF5018 domain-containing protein n=1 Tax=uncultured Maribacter sp. TaxID=431308 RepID=UPI0030EE73E3